MTDDLRESLDRSDELTRAARHDEHLALMREALSRHPADLEIVIRAGEASAVEAPERAAELVREAVKMAPGDPATLTRAALVMFYAKRLDEARKLCIRAMETATEDFALSFDLAYLGGQLFLAYGDQDKAGEFLQIAFNGQPETVGYGYALADLLERRGEYERALEVAEEAVRHRPGDEPLEEPRVRLRFAVHGVDALPPGYSVSYE